MKILLASLSLVFVLAQIPFFSQEPEKPKEEESPVKGWKMVSYFAVPPTQYSKAGKKIIKAESLGGRSSLFKEVKEKEMDYPIFSWGWKISNVVHSAIETRKDRFDAAARVMVVFGKEKSYRIFGGGEPIGLKIEYIWATRLPKGHIYDHPGEKDCRVFVLESGDGNAGQWVYENRNIQKDYKRAFGTEFPGILAVGLQTDTDQSNEQVTAYYSEPILKKR
jgi:hypothetical protein